MKAYSLVSSCPCPFPPSPLIIISGKSLIREKVVGINRTRPGTQWMLIPKDLSCPRVNFFPAKPSIQALPLSQPSLPLQRLTGSLREVCWSKYSILRKCAHMKSQHRPCLITQIWMMYCSVVIYLLDYFSTRHHGYIMLCQGWVRGYSCIQSQRKPYPGPKWQIWSKVNTFLTKAKGFSLSVANPAKQHWAGGGWGEKEEQPLAFLQLRKWRHARELQGFPKCAKLGGSAFEYILLVSVLLKK